MRAFQKAQQTVAMGLQLAFLGYQADNPNLELSIDPTENFDMEALDSYGQKV